MIYMKTEAYQRVNLSYHEHLPSWVLTFVPTKHGSHLLKSNITVEKPQFHIRFIRCYNIYRCTCVTYPSGCGSKWKTDVGPQMWMSSLVLTIQLLRYLILTHSHLSIFPFIFFSSVKYYSNIPRTFLLVRDVTTAGHLDVVCALVRCPTTTEDFICACGVFDVPWWKHHEFLAYSLYIYIYI